MSKENLPLFSSCQIFNNGSSYFCVLVLCLYQIMSFWFIHITTHRERRQILSYLESQLFFSHCSLPFESTLRIFQRPEVERGLWRKFAYLCYLHMFIQCDSKHFPVTFSCKFKIKTLTFPLNLKKEILHRRREREREIERREGLMSMGEAC